MKKIVSKRLDLLDRLQLVSVPEGATILGIHLEHSNPYLDYMSEETRPETVRRISYYVNDEPIVCINPGSYLGTTSHNGWIKHWFIK